MEEFINKWKAIKHYKINKEGIERNKIYSLARMIIRKWLKSKLMILFKGIRRNPGFRSFRAKVFFFLRNRLR